MPGFPFGTVEHGVESRTAASYNGVMSNPSNCLHGEVERGGFYACHRAAAYSRYGARCPRYEPRCEHENLAQVRECGERSFGGDRPYRFASRRMLSPHSA